MPEATVCRKKGKELLDAQDPILDELDILADGFENSQRNVRIIKIRSGYPSFLRMIRFYAIRQLAGHLDKSDHPLKAIDQLPISAKRDTWVNVGGQLIPKQELDQFRKQVGTGRIKSWEDVHAFYAEQTKHYPEKLLDHALASLSELTGMDTKLTRERIISLLMESKQTIQWLTDGIYQSRLKDYQNPFRRMVYADEAEMNLVMGSLENNSFMKAKKEECSQFIQMVDTLISRLS
jgi:hypothetical protein